MTSVPRPRLVESWDAPVNELALAGFDHGGQACGHRMVLWQDIQPTLLDFIRNWDEAEPERSLTDQSVLLGGSPIAFKPLVSDLKVSGFQDEGRMLEEVLGSPSLCRSLRLPRGRMTFERTVIVGIVNVTPDSFFAESRSPYSELALARAVHMMAEGAGVIEIGGEKAGPGAAVSEQEELQRVIPVVEEVRRTTDVVISIDTRKPEVARRAVDAGADIINDIDGMRNPGMRTVVADSGAAAVIMHIQGEPRVHQPMPTYASVVGDVTQFLHERIEACVADGISADRLVIDPGPSFGKTTEQDLSLMRQWSEFRGFPQPVMLAVSRKRFIGETLAAPPEELLNGSLAMAAYAVTHGVDMVRTHDVAATRDAIRIVEAVRGDCADRQ